MELWKLEFRLKKFETIYHSIEETIVLIKENEADVVTDILFSRWEQKMKKYL